MSLEARWLSGAAELLLVEEAAADTRGQRADAPDAWAALPAWSHLISKIVIRRSGPLEAAGLAPRCPCLTGVWPGRVHRVGLSGTQEKGLGDDERSVTSGTSGCPQFDALSGLQVKKHDLAKPTSRASRPVIRGPLLGRKERKQRNTGSSLHWHPGILH